MKLSFDEFNYCLPEQERILVINESEDSLRLLAKLNEYFGNKKKNACKVVSDDGQKYFANDFEFVYFPWSDSIEANYQFKQKSLFNTYLAGQIQTDEAQFLSVELLRNDLRNLVTDYGMYSMLKIVAKGLDNRIKYSIDNFDISNIISSFEIEFEHDSIIDRYLGVYNIAMHANRDKLLIVYVDAPITDYLLSWVSAVVSDNIIFILSGNFNSDIYIDNLTLYICRNTHLLHITDIEYTEFVALKYLFNPFVINNLSFQTSDNIDLFKQFDDNSTSFLLKVNNPKTRLVR